MGSGTSKSRKKPQHLPKVGTPANREWEHEGQMHDAFGGSKWIAIAVVAVLVVGLLGWLLLTL